MFTLTNVQIIDNVRIKSQERQKSVKYFVNYHMEKTPQTKTF